MEGLVDKTGWRLLRELQADARLSFSALARRIGMSTPAVAERVRRLEESGAIVGYQATVDRARLGRPLGAFLRLTTSATSYQRVIALCGSLDAVIECHHIKPLHTLAEAQTTRLEDLALLCSNCHRMVHARRPWLTVDDLKSLLSRHHDQR